MIGREIKILLQTQKRVTVPSLGSFMRRSDGAILFTDMLKDDDGVLTKALAASLAIGEQQAREEIARFATQTERTLAAEGCAELTDFGMLNRSADGKVVFIPFDETPQPQSIEATQQAEPATQPTQTSVATPAVPTPQPQAQPTPKATERPAQPPLNNEVTTPRPRPNTSRETRPVVDKPRRQVDWVLLAAIAAAVIALAVMAYGVVGSDMTSTIILE